MSRLSRIFAATTALILGTAPLPADNLSTLGLPPYWADLDPYQEKITRETFLKTLEGVYASPLVYRSSITIDEKYALIRKSEGSSTAYQLAFSPDTDQQVGGDTRYWRGLKELPPAKPGLPLSDLRIALDPGHIGGEWAEMEERNMKVGEDQAIKEGEITLMVARSLQARLVALGADVALVRDELQPLTEQRPIDFRNEAKLFLLKSGVTSPLERYAAADRADKNRFASIQWQSEKIFYRTSEIRARADRVNDQIRPDLVVCLHVNAEAWGDPAEPTYVDNNHIHLLINGNYMFGELGFDDIRFEMLQRLLQGTHTEERALASKMAPVLAEKTGLPAFVYPKDNAKLAGEDPYIFHRNLLANRLYRCPVVFLEPYVMNNRDVAKRFAMGDYLGRTLVGENLVESIYQEYVDMVVEGLLAYYKPARPVAEAEESSPPAPPTEGSTP